MLILVSTVTYCVSISVFVSLFCVPVCITSSAVGLDICAFIAGVKKYNENYISQLQKKRRRSIIK